jgi:1,4-alpha-glucan branching enzyme
MNTTSDRAKNHARQIKPARATKKRNVTFTLLSRVADDVRIAGDFNEWNQESHPLECHQGDTWSIDIPLEPGAHEYLFLVDGHFQTDPVAESVANPFGGQNSVVRVPDEGPKVARMRK